MHTQEQSIENHDTRQATTKEILSRLCPDKHNEHEWNRAVHDFLRINFTEIEARVVAHHLADGRTTVEEMIDFEPIQSGHTTTMRKVSEPEPQYKTPKNNCPDKLENGKCVRYFKACNNRCHSKY